MNKHDQLRWEHKRRHEELHHALDELVADFIGHTGTAPSKATVLELMQWSAKQTHTPDEGLPGEKSNVQN